MKSLKLVFILLIALLFSASCAGAEDVSHQYGFISSGEFDGYITTDTVYWDNIFFSSLPYKPNHSTFDIDNIDFRNFDDYVVFVQDKEESLSVQRALLNAGFYWFCCSSQDGTRDIDNIAIYIRNNGRLVSSIDFDDAIKYILKGESKPVTVAEVLADPFRFEGAKSKEKMVNIGGREVSESTIKKALKAYFD